MHFINQTETGNHKKKKQFPVILFEMERENFKNRRRLPVFKPHKFFEPDPLRNL